MSEELLPYKYLPSVFYNVKELNFDKRVELLKSAMEKQYSWHVDILDCRLSCARSRTNYSFEEIMKIFNISDHMVVINRGYQMNGRDKYGEIGFSTNDKTHVDYFLFIFLSEENLNKIITDFKLKKM